MSKSLNGKSFWRNLREARDQARQAKMFGFPNNGIGENIKHTKVAVLGAVEQNYGIYQFPSFYEQVTTLWNDPVLKEAIDMFAEQVVATGFFLTGNPKYQLKLNGKTALDIIKEWCEANKIDLKLFEIAVELKAFGNSFWRITDLGFVKIPVESVWHLLRVDAEVPLQEQYHLQLMPIYGGLVVPWKEFIHFRRDITGYHAPFGQGVIYSLLASPVDSLGRQAPSMYDVRLNMRRSLMQGFMNFSFGNELWCFEGLPDAEFEASAIGSKIANMSSTGNRLATNVKGDIKIAVPQRTQSYDMFIKHMNDEFFMSLADPSLKLGLEQGFTKATSVTASEVYKYKISTFRKTIKQHFEDLFAQILDKLGYDSLEAKVEMNFGPEETAVYNIADIFGAQDRKIVSRKRSLYLLVKYHKWDVDMELNDKELEEEQKELMDQAAQAAMGKGGATMPTKPPAPALEPSQTSEDITKKTSVGAQGTESQETLPRIEQVELPDSLGGYNKEFSKVYVDSLVPVNYQPLVVAHQKIVHALTSFHNYNKKDADEAGTAHEMALARNLGIEWTTWNVESQNILSLIKSRKSIGPKDLMRD